MSSQRSAWNDFLGRIQIPDPAAGTVAPEDAPGPRAAGPLLALLPHLRAIALTGADAGSFLQKQFTNDLDEVTETRGQLSGYCTPQGRLISIAQITRWPDGYLLRVPDSNAPRLIEGLTKYRLRARVEITELDLVAVGVARRELPWSLPADHDVALLDGAVAHRIPGDRVEILGDPTTLGALWSQLLPETTLGGPEAWVSLDVRAGIPVIVPATEDAFVPQMVNLDLVGGVSFTKGCYPGQEIVARLKYRGKLKRRMFRGWVGCPNRPLPGDDLSSASPSPSSTTGSAIGKVVSSAPAAGGGFDFLVSMQRSARDGAVLLRGHPLEWRDLPYPLDADTEPGKS